MIRWDAPGPYVVGFTTRAGGVSEGPFESLELMDDPYVLVTPADSPLAATRAPVGLTQISELPLIGHWTCRVLPRVEAELRSRGVEPNFVFRSDIIVTSRKRVRKIAGRFARAGERWASAPCCLRRAGGVSPLLTLRTGARRPPLATPLASDPG